MLLATRRSWISLSLSAEAVTSLESLTPAPVGGQVGKTRKKHGEWIVLYQSRQAVTKSGLCIKVPLSKSALAILEARFSENWYRTGMPSQGEYTSIALEINKSVDRTTRWFSPRRTSSPCVCDTSSASDNSSNTVSKPTLVFEVHLSFLEETLAILQAKFVLNWYGTSTLTRGEYSSISKEVGESAKRVSQWYRHMMLLNPVNSCSSTTLSSLAALDSALSASRGTTAGTSVVLKAKSIQTTNSHEDVKILNAEFRKQSHGDYDYIASLCSKSITAVNTRKFFMHKRKREKKSVVQHKEVEEVEDE